MIHTIKRFLFEWWCSLLDLWERVRGVESVAAGERPPIVYVDDMGVGWTQRPDYNEPWQPDNGHHEVWKREMRIYLYRCIHGHTVANGRYSLKPLDLGNLHIPVGTLNPMGVQLAIACRRLGFRQLAACAGEGLGLTEEAVHGFWVAHEDSVQVELARVKALAPQTVDADLIAIHTTGPFEGEPLEFPRAPLTPVTLTRDAVNNPSGYVQAVQPRARR